MGIGGLSPRYKVKRVAYGRGMRKMLRFFLHFWRCVLSAKEDHISKTDWLTFIAAVFFALIPWWSDWLKSEEAYKSATHWIAAHARYISYFSIAYLFVRLFWHSFCRWDDANNKLVEIDSAKPRLTIICDPDIEPGCEVGLDLGNGRRNKALRIAVKSSGIGNVTNCRGRLIKIRKGEVTKWGGNNVLLTFQPAEHDDTTSKTIYKNGTEYLDVLFINPNQNAGFYLDIGSVRREWIFEPTNNIFGELGEYILTIQFLADHMDAVTVECVFDHKPNRFVSTLRLITQP
jgi:hypothetical protein